MGRFFVSPEPDVMDIFWNYVCGVLSALRGQIGGPPESDVLSRVHSLVVNIEWWVPVKWGELEVQFTVVESTLLVPVNSLGRELGDC